ncbi:MAG: dihydropteroate synthase [Nocardioidaceae bacterium]|nr:dihydropteroate synthase [Nocardioidaceae bacterium]
MGVVNVTPDSFSDGGRWLRPEDAVAHGLALLADGADLLDVGGESTRPGAARIDEAEELARVVPVVRELASSGATVSVDTMRPRVARAAVDSGAKAVNDVSGGLADSGMLAFVAEAQVPYVLMHWRRHSADMQAWVNYGDVVRDVRAELSLRLDAAVAAGIAPERVVIDPGLGFAKTPEHNWQLVARLTELHGLGHPLLVGASRKRFLGRLLADGQGVERDVLERDDATVATTVLAALAGAWCVRVHEARGSADAVRVVARAAAG